MKKALLSLFVACCSLTAVASTHMTYRETSNAVHQLTSALLPTVADMKIMGSNRASIANLCSADMAIATASYNGTDWSGNLQWLQDSFIGKILAVLLLLATLPLLMFPSTLILFAILFIFKFDTLTRWFDKRAGVNITPNKRLDKSLLKTIPSFVVLFVACVLMAQGSVALGIAAITLIVGYVIFRVIYRTKQFGSFRVAVWDMLYYGYASFAILIIGVCLWWAALFVIGFKIAETFVSAPSHRSKCRECGFYMQSYSGRHYCDRLRDRQVEISHDQEACKHFYRP